MYFQIYSYLITSLIYNKKYLNKMSKETTLSFKELKKELRDIVKLSKDNLDIKSWATELKLWIKIQGITDPETIFNACLLTSSGEVQRVIEDLGEDSDDESDDSSDEEEDDEEENVDDDIKFPSLGKIISSLENFYGIKEDQNLLLKELRAMRIKRNEKIKDFNVRYRTLYTKLDKKRRKRIGVLDYIDSIQNNYEAWKKLSLKDDISMEKAFKIAEKVDRLSVRNNNINTYNVNNSQHNQNNQNSTTSRLYPKRRNETFQTSQTNNKLKPQDIIEESTQKMRNLSVKTCFFCKEEGHYSYYCPQLNKIMEKNKKEIYSKKSLNF